MEKRKRLLLCSARDFGRGFVDTVLEAHLDQVNRYPNSSSHYLPRYDGSSDLILSSVMVSLITNLELNDVCGRAGMWMWMCDVQCRRFHDLKVGVMRYI